MRYDGLQTNRREEEEAQWPYNLVSKNEEAMMVLQGSCLEEEEEALTYKHFRSGKNNLCIFSTNSEEEEEAKIALQSLLRKESSPLENMLTKKL